jgi:hypothetical protein
MRRFVGTVVGGNPVTIDFINIKLHLIPGDPFDINIPDQFADSFKGYLNSLPGIVFQETVPSNTPPTN